MLLYLLLSPASYSRPVLLNEQCLHIFITCFNHDSSSSEDKLQIVFLKKPRVTKNVSFYQNKNKMCNRGSNSGEMVIIYQENCNCEDQCFSNGRDKVTPAVGGSIAGKMFVLSFLPSSTCT